MGWVGGQDLYGDGEEEEEDWQRRRCFRIFDHRHGDWSPGNRVHNGCGSLGNSLVLLHPVGYAGRLERQAGGREMDR